MEKKTVYIETTVVSSLTARPTSDLVGAAWRKITVDWWETQRRRFVIVRPPGNAVEIVEAPTIEGTARGCGFSPGD